MTKDRNKKTIAFLRQYKRFLAEVRDIDIQLHEIDTNEDRYELNGVAYDGIKVSPTNVINSSTEQVAVRYTDKRQELTDRQGEVIIKIERIENSLEALTEEERDIINMKYIHNKRWYEVAYKLKMGERQCRRICERALNTITDILKL